MRSIALLGYALLGLLHQKPASGYDLRKIFSTTPMGGFSDSPGAIYPALRRLEEEQWIVAKSKAQRVSRRRRALELTAKGLSELKKWLAAPVVAKDVASRMSTLMLRFAFMDGVLGEAATLGFLHSLDSALRAYIPSLTKYLEGEAGRLPTSGWLAVESGIRGYKAQAEWVGYAISVYERTEETE